MAAIAAHPSPTVGPTPPCHRPLHSNSRDAFLAFPRRALPSRPFSLLAASKLLSHLDSDFLLHASCQVAWFLSDSNFTTAVADCKGDRWPLPSWAPSTVLVATIAFGFSWSGILLLPEEAGAASGGRMGGKSFDSSSVGSSRSGNSSSQSSLESSSRDRSSHGSQSRKSVWSEPSTSYSPGVNRPYIVHQESGFSFGSGFRHFDQETELVASVMPANPLSAPATVHSWTSHLNFLVFAGMFGASAFSKLRVRDASTILKLQVGLLGSARSLQEDLDRIANFADPSTKHGLHYILTETILALLRHPDYFSFGLTNVDMQRNIEHCEKRFNLISTEERAKLDEETLVNTVHIRSQSKNRRKSDGSCNEYIVACPHSKVLTTQFLANKYLLLRVKLSS